MLLTLTTTHTPASDLGYLLGKHPGKAQSFALGFGTAQVFYPEVLEERCTAALLLEVDPIGLVRGRPDTEAWVEHYVNDRPYAASSLLSVALARVFREALSGKSRDRAGLAETPLPLEAHVYALPARGGEAFLRALFEPLGYSVTVGAHLLDPRFPEWGQSPHLDLTLEGTVRLKDLLAHLYVLIPVLDDEKHYWVGEDEIDKLLRHGEGWLEAHPQKAAIARRYLKGQHKLTRTALERLTGADVEGEAVQGEREEEALESAVVPEIASPPAPDESTEDTPPRMGLHALRLEAVAEKLRSSGAQRVLDLGCGEGKLIRLLLRDEQFSEIVGVDVSWRTLELAGKKLRLERLPEAVRARVTLMQGSLTYRDARLEGYDAAALVEVIEHLDPPRLAALEGSVFGSARPRVVVLTTPNVEYNALFPALEAGRFRHRDHRFEWTRAEFGAWAEGVAARYGYALERFEVGPEDAERGSPTQGAVFTRAEESAASEPARGG